MGEARPHKLGREMAKNILTVGALFYNTNMKANFFRGIMRGLMRHLWIRKIIKEEQKTYPEG